MMLWAIRFFSCFFTSKLLFFFSLNILQLLIDQFNVAFIANPKYSNKQCKS